MQRFEAAARALAYAGVAAGAILATSGTRAAPEMKAIAPAAETEAPPIVVASLDERLTDKPSPAVSAGSLVPQPSARPARVRTIITGDASFYEEKGKTSSGERYDAKAFTAAAQILLRDQFGGIRYGRNYQPSYGVAEWGGKKAIVKFNDVGPLAPGRAFDFSRAAMEYFDGIDLGVLPHVTVTLLPLGRVYAQGPVTDTQLAAIDAEVGAFASAPAQALFVTASIEGTGCGSTLASLKPISLDAIQAKLVRTASLDFIAPAAAKAAERPLNPAELPNDLGITVQVGDLP